jgi:imidazolonepropionase-like amidohydrolase
VRCYGLDKEQALQLITSNTAKILGIDAQCGTLEIGKDATLFLSAGDALDMRTNKISHAFIQGRDISLETHQSEIKDIKKIQSKLVDQLRFTDKNRQFTLV